MILYMIEYTNIGICVTFYIFYIILFIYTGLNKGATMHIWVFIVRSLDPKSSLRVHIWSSGLKELFGFIVRPLGLYFGLRVHRHTGIIRKFDQSQQKENGSHWHMHMLYVLVEWIIVIYLYVIYSINLW